MHVPEHLINDTVEAAAALAAVTTLAVVALRPAPSPADRAATGRAAVDRAAAPTLLERPERPGSLAATAALVFALQMVNFPVLPGTSGHLLGGALATALIGPRRALFAVSAVVTTQALLFADGGAGALGVNLWLIAILPVALTALVQRLVLGPDARSAGRQIGAATFAALLGPPVAAAAFVALFVAGGTTPVGLGHLAASMLGVHLAIGVGEAVVTAMALATVVALSRGAARATPIVASLAVLVAGALSLAASSQPDGLERVAGDLRFAIDGPGSILHGSPLADYRLVGLDGWLSGSLAGLVGLAATCAIAVALGALVRSGHNRSGHDRSGQSRSGRSRSGGDRAALTA